MKAKNIIAVAFLVITVAFAIQLVPQKQVEARQVAAKKVAATQFAFLEVDGENKVTWRTGGNQVVRTETIRATFQRLGGRGPSEFIDLLNQIGSKGWNLVQKEGEVWIFSR